jgi:hypothetical protein
MKSCRKFFIKIRAVPGVEPGDKTSSTEILAAPESDVETKPRPALMIIFFIIIFPDALPFIRIAHIISELGGDAASAATAFNSQA